MFAVISYKGNQYKVEPDRQYRIDQISDLAEDQKEIIFSDVLLLNNGETTLVGQPTVKGANVVAEVIGQVKDAKVRVFKFHAKKRYKRQHNHRQDYTVIKVVKINKEA